MQFDPRAVEQLAERHEYCTLPDQSGNYLAHADLSRDTATMLRAAIERVDELQRALIREHEGTKRLNERVRELEAECEAHAHRANDQAKAYQEIARRMRNAEKRARVESRERRTQAEATRSPIDDGRG